MIHCVIKQTPDPSVVQYIEGYHGRLHGRHFSVRPFERDVIETCNALSGRLQDIAVRPLIKP